MKVEAMPVKANAAAHQRAWEPQRRRPEPMKLLHRTEQNQPCWVSTGLIPMPIVFSRPENGISRPENPQSREEQRTEQKSREEKSIAENSRAETKLRMENDSVWPDPDWRKEIF